MKLRESLQNKGGQKIMVEHETMNKLHVSHAEATLRTPKVTFQELQSQQWTPFAVNDDMNGIQWLPSGCMIFISFHTHSLHSIKTLHQPE